MNKYDAMTDKVEIEKIPSISEADLPEVISLYKSAFAEPPWNHITTDEGILEDLKHVKSQNETVMFFAKVDGVVVGFIWGFRIPFEEFPFFKGRIPSNSNWIDNFVVSSHWRRKGIGKRLIEAYVTELKNTCNLIITRTDVRNMASMTAFKKSGFVSFSPEIYDPVFTSRIYLKRELKSTVE